MGPAASVNQGILRRQRPHCKDPNLDRRVCLRPRRIVRKRLVVHLRLCQILQILNVTLFEKTPILQALQASDSQDDVLVSSNQLILFDF